MVFGPGVKVIATQKTLRAISSDKLMMEGMGVHLQRAVRGQADKWVDVMIESETTRNLNWLARHGQNHIQLLLCTVVQIQVDNTYVI
jgi:hypothetical protein